MIVTASASIIVVVLWCTEKLLMTLPGTIDYQSASGAADQSASGILDLAGWLCWSYIVVIT